MKLNLWLVIGLVLSSLAQAKIVEIKEMKEVHEYIKADSWVVFDLDNTVMEPQQTLGSDQWFEYMVKKLGSVDKAIEVWMEVQRKTGMAPVEATTPALIKKLQKDPALRVFALTARPAELDETTREQLDLMDVHFSQIVSVGPKSSKGEELKKLLTQSPHPARIVFIDDKEKHVKSVEKALDELGIDNFELRYGAADPKVHAFNADIADVQFDFFNFAGEIYSDTDARNVLKEIATADVASPLSIARSQAELEVNDGSFPGFVESCEETFSGAFLVNITCYGYRVFDLLEGDHHSSWSDDYLFGFNSKTSLFQQL